MRRRVSINTAIAVSGEVEHAPMHDFEVKKENVLMREKKNFSMSVLISCFAIAVLIMGLAGCSRDRAETTNNPNGVSAPVDDPSSVLGCSDVSASNCTIPQSFVLAGMNEQTNEPDNTSAAKFTVVIRNIQNQPIPYVEVKLTWLFNKYPDRPVCAVSPNVYRSSDGYSQELTTTTDANGVATFRAAGGYTSYVDCEFSEQTYRYGKVFVCGNELNPPTGGWFHVSTADLNAEDGVNSADLTLLLTDINTNCSEYRTRSDLDGNGVVNSADQSKLISISTGGQSTGQCQE